MPFTVNSVILNKVITRDYCVTYHYVFSILFFRNSVENQLQFFEYFQFIFLTGARYSIRTHLYEFDFFEFSRYLGSAYLISFSVTTSNLIRRRYGQTISLHSYVCSIKSYYYDYNFYLTLYHGIFIDNYTFGIYPGVIRILRNYRLTCIHINQIN